MDRGGADDPGEALHPGPAPVPGREQGVSPATGNWARPWRGAATQGPSSPPRFEHKLVFRRRPARTRYTSDLPSNLWACPEGTRRLNGEWRVHLLVLRAGRLRPTRSGPQAGSPSGVSTSWLAGTLPGRAGHVITLRARPKTILVNAPCSWSRPVCCSRRGSSGSSFEVPKPLGPAASGSLPATMDGASGDTPARGVLYAHLSESHPDRIVVGSCTVFLRDGKRLYLCGWGTTRRRGLHGGLNGRRGRGQHYCGESPGR